jgi:uncharacterized DUF497 family protein
MKLNVSAKVRQKLADKHNVQIEEIIQCFSNRDKGFLKDTRENHQTNPPTLWFIAETDYGRKLKVVFILEEDKSITIKTAYTANNMEISIYQNSKHA